MRRAADARCAKCRLPPPPLDTDARTRVVAPLRVPHHHPAPDTPTPSGRQVREVPPRPASGARSAAAPRPAPPRPAPPPPRSIPTPVRRWSPHFAYPTTTSRITRLRAAGVRCAKCPAPDARCAQRTPGARSAAAARPAPPPPLDNDARTQMVTPLRVPHHHTAQDTPTRSGRHVREVPGAQRQVRAADARCPAPNARYAKCHRRHRASRRRQPTPRPSPTGPTARRRRLTARACSRASPVRSTRTPVGTARWRRSSWTGPSTWPPLTATTRWPPRSPAPDWWCCRAGDTRSHRPPCGRWSGRDPGPRQRTHALRGRAPRVGPQAVQSLNRCQRWPCFSRSTSSGITSASNSAMPVVSNAASAK